MDQNSEAAAALKDLVGIISDAGMYDTRLAQNAGRLKILQRELDELDSDASDFDAVTALLRVISDAPPAQQRLKQLSEARLALVAAKGDVLDVLQQLEAKVTEHIEKLAAERAAHNQQIAKDRAELDRSVKAHEAAVKKDRAELNRQLDSARADAHAAAELKASLEARLAKLREVAA